MAVPVGEDFDHFLEYLHLRLTVRSATDVPFSATLRAPRAMSFQSFETFCSLVSAQRGTMSPFSEFSWRTTHSSTTIAPPVVTACTSSVHSTHRYPTRMPGYTLGRASPWRCRLALA